MVAVAVATLAAALLWGARAAHPAARPVAAGLNDGVVDVYTRLGYQQASAAGTGIVLSSAGEVLTNNHVIRGATSIRVVDVGTGHRYRASVVGYDVTGDVAVLKLSGATGMQTATLGNSSSVKVGDSVTAVGNAGGVGGSPTVASGTVTALGRSITVSDETGIGARLTGLIKTNASLQPGESGGPLLNGAGQVIGIDTAASNGFEFQPGGPEGFAIPINRAIGIVRQIDAGRSSAKVHIGPTAFLGVDVAEPSAFSTSSVTTGALVQGVLRGSAAAKAGLAPGDVIVSLNGRTISSPSALMRSLLSVSPGAKLQLRWVDQVGRRHSAVVRPASGPPQ
jgi:S1-C subfamily serine protease